MKILVCFKVVNDIDQILDKDWQVNEGKIVDISYANDLYNYFDEYALELALRLKDAQPEVEITALTVGNRSSRLMKNLLAVGIDRVVWIHTEQAVDFQQRYTAQLIERFFQVNRGYDLVLTGRKSLPADSGRIPFLVAEHLRLPAITEVVSVDRDEDGWNIRHQVDEGMQAVKVRRGTGLLLVTGNVDNCSLRIATLKQKLGIRGEQVQEIYAEDLLDKDMVLFESGVSVIQVMQHQRGRVCRMIINGSSADKAGEVYQLIKDRLEQAGGISDENSTGSYK